VGIAAMTMGNAMRHTARQLACLSILLSCLLPHALPAQETDEFIMVPAELVDTIAPPTLAEGDFEWLRQAGYDTVICPFRGRIDYEPGQIECGLIRVPENREVEGSRTIELHFVRIAARGEDADGEPVEVRDDPVIYLTGGPGVTVEGYVARLKDHGLLEQRDLYILEQRGIGYSGDFCPFFADRNRADVRSSRPSSAPSALSSARSWPASTARARPGSMSGYHTFENARDVKALRLALGLEQWNVWGISYGSVLGQAYMKVDPRRAYARHHRRHRAAEPGRPDAHSALA
jgi:hypothetical protein